MSVYTFARLQAWSHPADVAVWRENGRRRDDLPPVTAAWRVSDAMSNVSPGIVYRPQDRPVAARGYLVVPTGSTMPADDAPMFPTLREAAHALAMFADTNDARYLFGASS